MVQATALIDGNNFYAACEQSIDPSLVGKPLVVLSNNDGCIVARSSEARALGISMGKPYFKIRHELDRLGVVVRSSNYALYGDMSQRLMETLKSNCEQLEIYSIDEAFVHLSSPFSSDLCTWARQLRAKVHRDLGLPVSIGLGTSKGQAKLANHLAKAIPAHAGVFNLLATSNADPWLQSIAIENVWGVGRELAKWCRLRGIKTALQLRDMPSHELSMKCGITGIRLQHELHGQACLPLVQAPAPKKETCVSQSFRYPINNFIELRQAIATYVVRASEKLRRQRQHAGSITVFTRSSPFSPSFYKKTATAYLDLPSNNTADLLQASLPLTKEIFHPHRRLIKAGVTMRNLHSANYLQQHLLLGYSEEMQERREQLMKTIDHLNLQYGNGTVNWAICGLQPKWRMRRDLLSHASTTCLKQIPIVKA